MDFKSVAELETLIKMLRKQGVDIIKLGELEIVLGKQEPKVARQKRVIQPNTTYDIGNIDENVKIPIEQLSIPTDEPTEEQILFGSSDPSVWDTQQ